MAEWGSLWRCQRSLLLACSLRSDTHVERPTRQRNDTVSAPVCRAQGPSIAALVYLIIRAFSPPISERDLGTLQSILCMPAHQPLSGTMLDARIITQYTEWTSPLLGESRVHVLFLDELETGNLIRALGLWENWVTALTNSVSHSAVRGCTHAHLHKYACLPGCLLGSRQTPDGPRKYAGIIHCQVYPVPIRGRAADGAGGSHSQLMGRGWEMGCHPNMHWTGFCL